MAQRKTLVEIKGISALLMHAYPMVPIEALEKKPAAEQAEHAVYRDPATEMLYVPAVALQRAFVGGAAYSKGKGRGSLAKVAAACVIVSPERLSLGVKEYVVDSRPVVIPATRGRILRHRPRLDEWGVAFVLEWDDALLSEKQARAIVDDTGSRVGLLEFRPEKRGPFGRFMVTRWRDEK